MRDAQDSKGGTAKGIIQYIDGTIEWDHSSDGHFANKDEDE